MLIFYQFRENLIRGGSDDKQTALVKRLWNLVLIVCGALANIFLPGEQKNKAPDKPPAWITSSGYVRSAYVLHEHPDANHSVIGFERDDGRFISLCFDTIETHLWPGIHVKIEFQESRRGTVCGQDGTMNSIPLYRTGLIDRLDK